MATMPRDPDPSRPEMPSMLVDAGTPLAKAWNTWSERPAELVFLPLGVRLTPVLHSSVVGRATALRPVSEVRFGRHGLHGEAIDFEARYGGTCLAFAFDKPDPFVVRGSWTALEQGEWGLRFSVVLGLSAEGGQIATLDGSRSVATIEIGGRFVALVSEDAPVLVTGHPSVEDLVADLDQNGYFDKSRRSDAAALLALRFNLEMMPRQRFALAVADHIDLAVAKARAALRGEPALAPKLQDGRNDGALDAVRDVVGWNTVYDRRGRRPTTTASRIWGLGDAVWYNDQCFAALLAGLLDSRLGRANLDVAMANATPQGNIACFTNPKDAWVDRSQAPHGAFVAWSMYLRCRDRSLLADAFPILARNQLWWREHRDPEGRGLVSCGTSDVGDAMYRGTAFGARNETGMDNSSTHDEAVYDPVTRTLSTFDVGLNAALALDAEMLARMASELGLADDAARFTALESDTRERIKTELWDEARGLFANRQRSGDFVRSVSPTSFFPLLCGAATPAQAARLLQHLADPGAFAGAFVLPNATRDDPAFPDNTYWRGRIWPNVNYLVWQGLRRYGFEAEAGRLAHQSLDLFRQSWTKRRLCGENYGAETGEINDKPGNDPFYTWGALLPLLGVAGVMDIGPWNGWEVTNAGNVRLGPLVSPAGLVTLTVQDGVLELVRGQEPLFATSVSGRLTHLRVEPGLVSATLAEGCRAPALFRLGPALSRRFVVARLGNREVASREYEGCRWVDLAAIEAGARLDFHLAPDP